jgi:hypothetical protein
MFTTLEKRIQKPEFKKPEDKLKQGSLEVCRYYI